ncbi:MAG: 3'-5' exonuclease, partial [Chloroflexia bacterium]|nr:3'-5' exonuclease [Chloroflexia bacterium]
MTRSPTGPATFGPARDPPRDRPRRGDDPSSTREISAMPFAFCHLVLGRPLAVVDLETTGVDARRDRIIEVGILKVAPDHGPIRYRRLVNPGIPIPPAAHAIHGIADEDVADLPRFRVIAPQLARLLAGADLAGF